jgi:hypothetical protein
VLSTIQGSSYNIWQHNWLWWNGYHAILEYCRSWVWAKSGQTKDYLIGICYANHVALRERLVGSETGIMCTSGTCLVFFNTKLAIFHLHHVLFDEMIMISALLDFCIVLAHCSSRFTKCSILSSEKKKQSSQIFNVWITS